MPVIIEDYNPQWPCLYDVEEEYILSAIRHLCRSVEHIDSTSVPGLGAKAIIDIMVGLRQLADAKFCIPLLESIG